MPQRFFIYMMTSFFLVVSALISNSTVSDWSLNACLASAISIGISVPLSAFLIIYQSVAASLLPI